MVHCAETIAKARHYLSICNPDALVLDSKLSDGSGLEFCCEIRSRMAVSILFFATAGSKLEIMEAFQAGGNDYIPTPYPKEEFAAWVAAHVHLVKMVRKQGERIRIIERGILSLDVVTARATMNGEDLLFTPKEFALLLFLIQGEGEYFTSENLYEQIWKCTANNDNSALKSAISRLRKKLKGSGFGIHSHRGKGYCFEKGESYQFIYDV